MFNARRALSVSFTLAELPHDGFRPLYTALYIENKSCNTLLFYDALGVGPRKALDREFRHGRTPSQTTRNNELSFNQNNNPSTTCHGQTVRRIRDGGQTIVPHNLASPNP